MDPMQYRTLGRSGLKVSPICLGTMMFGGATDEADSGRIVASVEIPIPGQYGMMTYMHNGKQFIVVQAGSAKRNQPGALVALTLP